MTCGSDGSVKLFHIFEKFPLGHWEPQPNPGTNNTFGSFVPITDVKFSPIRSAVFACASSDGFLYIYDLTVSMISPIEILDTLDSEIFNANNENNNNSNNNNSNEATGRIRVLKNRNNRNRIGITSISFNHKQRDIISATDYSGKIHLWKLNWKLANRCNLDENIMNNLNNINNNMNE